MKISTNTIEDIAKEAGIATPLVASVPELATKIGAQLGAIEEITDFGAKYDGVIIAKVITCVDHPNADRLHVCTIDDGGNTPDVKRDEQGYVQVVCGAPNVREGLLVAWLPPGSTVPETIGKDPFVLGARELRGVMSNGMLASPKELAISDSHDGILEIDEDIAPGTTFADAYGLTGDAVLDIENKMFTHRPDCFGWLGVAREVAGIQHVAFKSPAWYREGNPTALAATSKAALPLVVANTIPELVPRFIAVTMSDVTVAPSPLRLQLRLVRHGVRPINNVVDITNYLMLETGQPMHAYDYDKVRALDAGSTTATIGVRLPKGHETLELLNGKTIEPHQNAILIATANEAIGLGGVMGGANTEVDETTTNIILECASFDMYSIRKTSMHNGIVSDAVTRFNKGQSPLQNKQVTARAVELFTKLAGAHVVAFYDDDHTNPGPIVVRVSAQFINERLGLTLSAQEMKTLLENVEFVVAETDGELSVTVPFWRTDIAIPEDIVEEVGRLYGYDELPLTLPNRTVTPTEKDPSLSLKSRVRAVLSRAGANEVLSYTFVHGNLLAKAGQNPDDAFSLSNAISPDLQYYRLSITPSLLDKIHPNIKTGHAEFALFEIGRGHSTKCIDKDGLPIEWTNVALVYAADAKAAKAKQGAAYYEARTFVGYLLDELGIDYAIVPIADEPEDVPKSAMLTPFDTTRRAAVVVGDKHIGYVGEYNAAVTKAFKLPEYSAGFELDFAALLASQRSTRTYTPLSRYPDVEQDMTYTVANNLAFAELQHALQAAFHAVVPADVRVRIAIKDMYAPKDSDTKNITFRARIVSYEHTLTDAVVNDYVAAASDIVAKQLNAKRV